MHTINPIYKFFGLLFPTLILAAIHDPLLNFITFIVCLVLLAFSQVRLRTLLLLLVPIFLAAVGMFFTGYYFQAGSGTPVNVENMNLTSSAVWNGLILSSRVLVYGSLGYLFALTTDKIELIRSTEQQLKLSPLFSYGLMAAWNIFPNLIEEYKKTRIALQARGIRSNPLSPRLLKPMLIKAVLWSEALATAMESKGFNGRTERTEYVQLKLTLKDYLFPILTTGLFTVIYIYKLLN